MIPVSDEPVLETADSVCNDTTLGKPARALERLPGASHSSSVESGRPLCMSRDYQLITLTIAVFGLALAVASLTWQAVTFVLSDSRVKVELHHGAHDGAGNLISGAPLAQALRQAAEQGFVHEVIRARVRNVGHMAVTVERMEAVLANGIKLSHPQGQLGPSRPYRLEAQSSESWFMPMQPVRQAVHVSAQAWGQAMAQHVADVLPAQRLAFTRPQARVAEQLNKYAIALPHPGDARLDL
jgi:hypothetical protein